MREQDSGHRIYLGALPRIVLRWLRVAIKIYKGFLTVNMVAENPKMHAHTIRLSVGGHSERHLTDNSGGLVSVNEDN